ncbi:response regulator transcription factor [Bifidobacterium sp. AGR2158]|uniref:response regulator transcription factor n=1 Tax=Bifidobacterium sp. AGR2158 TaxID=1280675 RepID=UPI0012DFE439|nr:response regulator transcription factor [Bifidobacterium sp. AGR2158]
MRRTTKNGNVIHIGIVDNDPCSLRMLALMVGHASPTFQVIWTADCAQHVLEHCLYDQPNLRANVILMDMALNEESGANLSRRIRKHDGRTGIIGITAYPASHYRDDCIDAGLQGLLEKCTLSDTGMLMQAIERAAQGEGCDPSFINAHDAYLRLSPTNDRRSLTSRELEIISLYAKHKSTEDIARQLGISAGTVFSHIHHALPKLGVTTRNEAILACQTMHLI